MSQRFWQLVVCILMGGWAGWAVVVERKGGRYTGAGAAAELVAAVSMRHWHAIPPHLPSPWPLMLAVLQVRMTAVERVLGALRHLEATGRLSHVFLTQLKSCLENQR